MIPHDEGCICAKCAYKRILKRVRDQYKADQFKAMYNSDPFATFGPEPIKKYYCDVCQAYHLETYKHKEYTFRNAYTGTRTGRFNVSHPNTEQKSRTTHPGKYRRVYNQPMDMVEFQYQPWPDAEWHTYHTVAMETLNRNIGDLGGRWATTQTVMNATKALGEKRYYKLERVDKAA